MKPIYKSVSMASVMLAISLQLSAELNNAGEITSQKVQAESLQGLSVKLVSPNVSGAKDLIASGDCVLENEYINVNLSGLAQGTHRLTVSAEYGTQTVVLYVLDIFVPSKLVGGEQEFEDEMVVVSTYSDGAGTPFDPSEIQQEISQLQTEVTGKADGSVYAKDGDGRAHITKPLSVGSGTAAGGGATASGYVADGDSQISASGFGATASGCAGGGGSQISASGLGASVSGRTIGGGSKILASGAGATANGCATGDGSQISASGEGAVAMGYTDSTSGNVEAPRNGSQAFGIGTKAAQNGQMVLGKCNVVDTNGDYALIVGNGTADNARSNAFAIDWQGNLVLFNTGTPVVLTPAKLAQLIA